MAATKVVSLVLTMAGSWAGQKVEKKGLHLVEKKEYKMVEMLVDDLAERWGTMMVEWKVARRAARTVVMTVVSTVEWREDSMVGNLEVLTVVMRVETMVDSMAVLKVGQ